MTIREVKVGQDSFLDIVANLVGILIILVVLVGAQAKVAWKPTELPPDQTQQVVEMQQKLEQKRNLKLKMEQAHAELELETQKQVAAIAQLNQVRHQMLVQIDIAEKLLNDKRTRRHEQLDQQRREELALLSQEKELRNKLSEIETSLNALASATRPKSEIIEHFPNPIAKTVFTEEIHFQIKGGKIVYVPLEELLQRMKADVQSKVEQLRQSPTVSAVVGPIRNFQLQYELAGEVIQQTTANGVIERMMVQFNGFQLIPSSSDLGIEVDQELSPEHAGSEFKGMLQRFPAGKTTVSLWTYPDSFAEYNRVKNWLYAQGYQVACWPLDHGKRIAGSPSGFRTSAQ